MPAAAVVPPRWEPEFDVAPDLLKRHAHYSVREQDVRLEGDRSCVLDVRGHANWIAEGEGPSVVLRQCGTPRLGLERQPEHRVASDLVDRAVRGESHDCVVEAGARARAGYRDGARLVRHAEVAAVLVPHGQTPGVVDLGHVVGHPMFGARTALPRRPARNHKLVVVRVGPVQIKHPRRLLHRAADHVRVRDFCGLFIVVAQIVSGYGICAPVAKEPFVLRLAWTESDILPKLCLNAVELLRMPDGVGYGTRLVLRECRLDLCGAWRVGDDSNAGGGSLPCSGDAGELFAMNERHKFLA